jgi:hypothetical protein
VDHEWYWERDVELGDTVAAILARCSNAHAKDHGCLQVTRSLHLNIRAHRLAQSRCKEMHLVIRGETVTRALRTGVGIPPWFRYDVIPSIRQEDSIESEGRNED